MSENSGWLPPETGSDHDEQWQNTPAVPRYGAYGSAPAGYPSDGAQAPGAQPSAGPAQGDWGAPDPSAPYAQGAGSPGGFFLAPKPGIIPLRPLGVTEIIGGAVESLRANPRAMFLPALVVMSIVGLVSALLSALTSGSLLSLEASASSSAGLTGGDIAGELGSSLGSTSIQSVVTAIACAVLTGLLIVTVSRSVLGRVATPGEVWNRTRGRVWALIGQSLLISLMTTVVAVALIALGVLLVVGIVSAASSNSPSTTAIVLAVLAGLVVAVLVALCSAFLWVRLALAPAALVLENVGVIDGIKRSWQLTRGSFWRILGILLLAGVIQVFASALLGGLAGVASTVILAAAPDQIALSSALTMFLSTLMSALVLPFTAAVTALTYIDLRMRREGLDVELRQASAS